MIISQGLEGRDIICLLEVAVNQGLYNSGDRHRKLRIPYAHGILSRAILFYDRRMRTDVLYHGQRKGARPQASELVDHQAPTIVVVRRGWRILFHAGRWAKGSGSGTIATPACPAVHHPKR